VTEYGETRQRALDGFERYRMAGLSLGAAWPAADDARAAAVQPFLGAIALSGAAMRSSLDAQEGAHVRLDDSASRASEAADLATSRAQIVMARVETAAAATDAARTHARGAEAAAEAGAGALAEVRASLVRIAARP